MKSSLYISILILFICLCVKMPVKADTVELKTGKVFEGKVLVVDTKNVKVKDETHLYILNKDDVARIIFDDAAENNTNAQNNSELSSQPPANDYNYRMSKPSNKKYKNIKYAESTGKYDEKPKKSKHNTEVVSSTPNVETPQYAQQPEVTTENNQNIENTSNMVTTPEVVPQTKKAKKPKKEKKKKTEQIASMNTTQNTQMNSNNSTMGDYNSGAPINLSIPSSLPGLEYITSIDGSSSKNTYYGIYSNSPEDKNLTVYLPNKKIKTLSFNLFAQKNGSAPALYTASSVIFIDKNGIVISKSNPYIIENDNFLEWFSNLEDIAGITGEKQISIDIPPGTSVIKIIGYRPESRNNLVGYISEVKLDNKTVKNIYNK